MSNNFEEAKSSLVRITYSEIYMRKNFLKQGRAKIQLKL